jgi:hypothetical protein
METTNGGDRNWIEIAWTDFLCVDFSRYQSIVPSRVRLFSCARRVLPFTVSNIPHDILAFFPFIRRNLKIDRFHLLSSRSTDGIVAEPIIRTAKRKPGLPASARPCPIHPYTRARTSTSYLSIYLPLTSELHAQPTHSAASGLVGLPETCRRNRNGRDNAFIEKRHFWTTEITMAQFTTNAGGKYETSRVAFALT